MNKKLGCMFEKDIKNLVLGIKRWGVCEKI